MPKRLLDDGKNRCKEVESPNGNGRSNVKNFYGSKMPIPNRWLHKENNWNNLQGTSSRSSLLEESSSPQKWPNTKTLCKLDKEINSSCEHSSPQRTPKRLCTLNSSRNATTKTPTKSQTNDRRLTNSHPVKTVTPKRRTPKRLCKRDYENKALDIKQSNNKDTQIKKLKNLSKEIDTMDNENDNLASYVHVNTQTSLSSNLDSSQLSSSNSPITSCRSSPFLVDNNVIFENEDNDGSKNNLSESPMQKEENQDGEEAYEMFNCDLESHSTSIRSDISSNSSSPKKTPKRNKTILNYFSRVGSSQNDESKSHKIKFPAQPTKNNNHKQLHFSAKGLSPKSSELTK